MKSQDGFFELGRVVKVHGLKGEISIQMDVDDPSYYQKMESVFLQGQEGPIPFFVDAIRIQGKRAVLALEGINAVEEADGLVGHLVLLPENMLPPMEEGGFYYHQIIGFAVIDSELGALGEVSAVYESTGQDLIAMRYKGQEVLIPVTDEHVLRADLKKEELHTALPEGLLDIYLEP